MRVRFVLGEVFTGIRRNLTMTIAVVITVAVSLALFGAGLMVRSQVDLMKDYWYDKVQVSIYLCGSTSEVISCAEGPVTQAQREEIRADLESLQPLVEEVYYESSAEAFERFSEQFKDAPILSNITPDQMPESFRVKLSDPTKYDVVASAFIGRPGIDSVNDQRRVLDKLFAILNGFQTGALVIAGMMLLATVLLVANTIRVAAFSRRRETGIMRLVGRVELLHPAAVPPRGGAGRDGGSHGGDRPARDAQGGAGRWGADAELPVHQLRRMGRVGPGLGDRLPHGCDPGIRGRADHSAPVPAGLIPLRIGHGMVDDVDRSSSRGTLEVTPARAGTWA